MLLPDLRRRIGTVARAGGRRLAGRKAGRHAAAQRGRGQHRGAEHGPQAAQPDQGRRPGAGLPRRAAGLADHLRRAGRSARRDRLRADGAGPLDAGGGAGDPRASTCTRTSKSRRAALAYLRSQRLWLAAPTTATATCQVTNLVIGNNAVAVDAAGVEAERRGYSHAMDAATKLEGPAEDVGRHLAQMAPANAVRARPRLPDHRRRADRAACPAEIRGKGGRNQQLVLAALVELSNAEFGMRMEQIAPNSALRIPHSAFPASSPAAPTAKTARPTLPARSSTPTLFAAMRELRPRSRRLPPPQRRLPLLPANRRPDPHRPHPHQRLRRARGRRRSVRLALHVPTSPLDNRR